MKAKKLYRSTTDTMIGGVCAGIAEYFNIDPTIVRLLAVILFFADGIGFLFYFLAWIIIPERKDYIDVDSVTDDEDDLSSEENNRVFTVKKGHSPQRILGIILIGAGIFFILDKWFFFIRWYRLWPLILIAFGVYFVIKGVRNDG